MDLIEEISGYIDNNSGLFVFGFLNYMDEIIVDAMINDILLKIKKPIVDEHIKKHIKYANSSNRKVSVDMKSSNSFIKVSMEDILDQRTSNDDSYGTFSRRIIEEFTSASIRKKNTLIVKAQLYSHIGAYSNKEFSVTGGNEIILSCNFYCSVFESKCTIHKNRYGRHSKSYDVSSYLLSYLRDIKLDALIN